MLFRSLLVLAVSATAALAVVTPASGGASGSTHGQKGGVKQMPGAKSHLAQGANAPIISHKHAKALLNQATVDADTKKLQAAKDQAAKDANAPAVTAVTARDLEEIVARAVQDHYEGLSLRSYIPEDGLYARSYDTFDELYERDAEPDFDGIYARDFDEPQWYFE